MKIRLAILVLIVLLLSGCMQPVEPLIVGFWNVEICSIWMMILKNRTKNLRLVVGKI